MKGLMVYVHGRSSAARIAWLAAAFVLPGLVLLFAAAVLTLGVRASRIAFPSSQGSTDLVRTRLDLARVLWFETWQYPAGMSYSFRVPFESLDPSGATLQCRFEMEGWLRYDSRHRDLLDLYCVCERTDLHDNRERSCPYLP